MCAGIPRGKHNFKSWLRKSVPYGILPFAMLSSLVPGAQIIVSALLVTVILLQPSSAGIGGAFGGSDGMQAFRTKRGFEKFLFIATIILGIVFAGLCVLAVVLR